MTARTQQPVSLPIADRRIDPVPGGRGIDEVERRRLALPRLEGRDVDLDRTARKVAARPLRELRAHLYADDAKATLAEPVERARATRCAAVG